MLIKVCGIMNLDDALMAVDCGATALGFNFYPSSPRYTTFSVAAHIRNHLPDDVRAVAVVVKGSGDWQSVDLEGLDVIQIHGLKLPEEIPDIPQTVWVATSAEEAAKFPDHEIMIDTSWGKGKRADWKVLRHLKRSCILSGGLTAENVGEAIELLHPAGIDVCSGVESSPGKKDPEKLKNFFRAISYSNL